MRVRVLGCYGNAVGSYRTTAFLVNDVLLLDAGTVTEVLDDEEIKRIRYIVVTHTHLDHLKGFFPLIDQLVMLGAPHELELSSAKDVLDIISQNLFNDLVWPDFTIIPSEQEALIRLEALEMEQAHEIGALTVTPIPVNHTVYTVGYVVKEGAKGFMFTGDTGPTERFWEIAATEEGIEFIIADVSFPDRMRKFAQVSGHMTLSMLLEEIDRHGLGGKTVYLNHIKPIFLGEVVEEVRVLGRGNIRVLEQDRIITI
jgi:ribonuclease BN (tRNA processing enzyme)